MNRRKREELDKKLAGFEFRQQERDVARAARARKAKVTAMMRLDGTLKGAKAYLSFKGVQFTEAADPVSGHITILVPGQISLVYGSQGKFLRSGPPNPR